MHLSKNKISQYSNLGQSKMRSKYGLFAVEGWKSVADSMPYFELEALILVGGKEVSSIYKELSTFDIDQKTYEVDVQEMKKLSSFTTPSDIIAVFRLPKEDLCSQNIDKSKLYLMLDGVRDPGNMGTILRTAHWFGINKIFASKDCVDIYNPKTVQSAMGSLGRVKVIYCDLKDILDENPEMPVYGTFLEGDNIYESNLTQNGFVIMGNEGKGVSEEIRNKVDHKLLIPPYDRSNHSESLNVGIATGVILALFRKSEMALK